jgi:hypothetical protein
MMAGEGKKEAGGALGLEDPEFVPGDIYGGKRAAAFSPAPQTLALILDRAVQQEALSFYPKAWKGNLFDGRLLFERRRS